MTTATMLVLLGYLWLLWAWIYRDTWLGWFIAFFSATLFIGAIIESFGIKLP